MKIAAISFGKTVKINGSYSEAHEASNLINSPHIDRRNKVAQKKLKEIFNDITPKGDAYVYALGPNQDRETFILTGKESEKAGIYYNQMVEEIIDAGEYYGAGETYDIASDIIIEDYQKKMRSLINSTREDYEISLAFDESKSKIRSVEIIC